MEGLVFRGWNDQIDEDVTGFMRKTLPTSPKDCVVSGPGIDTCIARNLTTFVIDAFDCEGIKQESVERCDADNFVVIVRMVRGGNQVLSRVIPHGNGSYTVGFKPNLSGKYCITITLLDKPVADSPYYCVVAPPRPSAPKCIVQGGALLKALAREPQHFEVGFRDALGQVTHAEELDVYAVAVGDETEEEQLRFRALSPRRRELQLDAKAESGSFKKKPAAAGSRTATAESGADSKSGKASKRADGKPTKTGKDGTARAGKESASGKEGAKGGAPADKRSAGEAAMEAPPEEPEFIEGSVQRQCVITSRKPLIVREGFGEWVTAVNAAGDGAPLHTTHTSH